MNLKSLIFTGDQQTQIKDAYYIRDLVFTHEQGYDPNDDIDGYDGVSTHIVIYDGNSPIATARLIAKKGTAKIGRVAVLKEYRSQKIGSKIMLDLLTYAKKHNFPTVSLSSQTHAQSFYEKLGFIAEGDIYLEEGQPHILMHKHLK